MRKPGFWLAVATIAACGGSTVPTISDDTTSDGGTTLRSGDGGLVENDGGNGHPVDKDSGPGLSDSGSKPDSNPGASCDDLQKKVDDLRPAAIGCSNASTTVCTQHVDDLCCPATVTDANSESVREFEAAVKAWKDAKCTTNCPAVACKDPSKKCSGLINATCQQN